jgi:hypothetical protein
MEKIMKLQIPTYPISHFIRTSTHVMAAELSQGFQFGQIYDDACDSGFAIEGKTRTVTFSYLTSERCLQDDGLLSMTFTPVADDYNQPIQKIILFND